MTLSKPDAALGLQAATSSPLGSATIADSECAEVAGYIAELSLALAAMARSQQFDVLAYLLDQSHMEAEALRQRYRSRSQ